MRALALLSSLAVVGALAAPARAEPERPSGTPGRNSIYVEVLGKGGLWGLGYGRVLRPRLALGVVGSLSVVDGQRIGSLSPFVTTYLVGTRHRWFVDLGPQVVRVSTPSPVPEWMGTSSTGLGGQLATGYEHRARVVVRAFVMAVAGKGGVAPWVGAAVGWRL